MKRATTVSQIREALGLTREDFAKKIGVNEVTVWRWERDGPPQKGTALAYLQFLAREAGFPGGLRI